MSKLSVPVDDPPDVCLASMSKVLLASIILRALIKGSMFYSTSLRLQTLPC